MRLLPHRRKQTNLLTPSFDTRPHQSATPCFPQELFDAIIDELHSDKKTLATCSLVCKAWLPSARIHLFAFVRLYTHDLFGFKDFVESHSSTSPFRVRHLYIISVWAVPPLKPGQLLHTIDLIGPKLLELTKISFKTSVFSNKISTLVCLSLRRVDFDFFSDVVNFICALPSLRILRMRSVFYTSDDVPLPLPPSNLQDIDLDLAAMRDIMKWYLLSEKIPPIRAFWHSVSLRTISGVVFNFLRAASSTLERINLEPTDHGDHFNLSSYPQLRFIHFHVKESSSAWEAEWVIKTLSQIHSNQLEEVSMFLAEWKIINWSRLDTILTQPHFSQLRKLEIFCRGTSRSMVDIEDHMPGCRARGILFFTNNCRWDYRGFLAYNTYPFVRQPLFCNKV